MPPPRGDIASFATSAGAGVLGRGLGRLLHLGTTLLLARVAGPTAFGVYALGWTIARYLALVASLGLEQGAIRFGAEQRSDPRAHRAVVRDAIAVAALVGVALAAAGVACSPFIGARFFHDEEVGETFQIFAVAVPLMSVLIVLSAAMRVGSSGVRSSIVEDIVQPAAALVITVALFGVWPGVLAASVGLTASFLVALIAALVAARHDLRPLLGVAALRVVPLSRLLRFSLAAALSSRLAWLIVWANRVVVGTHLGPHAVGLYQAAAQLAMLFPVMISGVSAAVTPLMAELAGPALADGRRRIYVTSTRWCMLLCLPGLVVGAILPRDVLTVVYGAAYADSATSLAYLLVAQLVNASTGLVGVVLVMGGRQRAWLGWTAALVGVDIVASILLVPRVGAVGAAMATALVTTVLNVAGVALARRSGVGLPWDRTTIPTAFAYVVGAALVAGSAQLTCSPAARLVGATLACFAVVAMAILVAMRDPDADEAALFERIRARVRSR